MQKQEQIQLKTRRKNTLVKYFTTYSGQTSEEGFLSYLIVSNNNKKIVESLNETTSSRNNDNYFKLDQNHIIYSGYCISQQLEHLSQNTKDKIRLKYIKKIEDEYLLNGSNGNTILNSADIHSHVQFEDVETDDMYININLIRTIDNLDTLSVHNVPVNNQPTLESTTGVLMGRLTAKQKVLDENGERVIIPLKNTVVAIFNPSETFPSVASVDDNQNRVTLNLRENISLGNYFNQESLKTDYKFLNSSSNINNIPDHYKYTSITNDNGEFIIHNVPVGEQTFMFEINALKQGLTPDEVALNFGPYPLESFPQIDQIPHYYFRQIPVYIVPTWGESQSGYTQMDLKVNFDLRKWCTYYVSPIAYKNKSIEEMYASGVNSKLTVAIRDMTKPLELESRPDIEVVEISDVYDRNFDQVSEWRNETFLKREKNKAEFLSSQFGVFKLPANLYAPTALNSNGVPGVWLNAYQFKMFYGDASIYRASGYDREWIVPQGSIGKNHFDLNKNATPGTINPIGRIGIFPYEKPWTINYPEPFKIPKPPSVLNTNKSYDSNGNPLDIKEPVYLDGDVAGDFYNNSSGYGLQNISGEYNPNQLSREISKSSIFKYESIDAWGEQFSNGFTPVLDNDNRINNGLQPCDVLNGEGYQRLEAGYSYWLKPEGWPRIVNYLWGDALFDNDHIPGLQNIGGLSPANYADYVYKIRENILFKMDRSLPVPNGSLDIYRILKPKDVVEPLPPPVSKAIIINFQDLIFEGRRSNDPFPTWLAVGSQNDKQFNRTQRASLRIKNQGSTKVTIEAGGILNDIEAEQWKDFSDCISPNSEIVLPANSAFDSNTNSYTKAKYEVTIRAIITDIDQGGPWAQGTGEVAYGGLLRVNHLADVDDNPPKYYVVTRVPTIVFMDGQSIASLTNFAFLDGTFSPPLVGHVVINGFPFCLWRYNWPFANHADWIESYYDTAPRFTPNPYMRLESNPINTPFVDSQGHYPFALE